MIERTEQALIGGILHSPEKLVDIVDIVKAGDFKDQTAETCYLHAVTLWKNGEKVDPVIIASRDYSLSGYIAESTTRGAGFAVVDYAREVRTAAKERRLKTELSDILSSKGTVKNSLDRILSLYQREMDVGRKNPNIKNVLRRFYDKVAENKERGSMGIPTGFSFLQQKYIEYVQGHIWTIGGWTSTGKTAVAVQKICNLIDRDDTPSVVVISTEMTEEQFIARLLSNFTRVHTYRILSGKYHDAEEEYRVDKWSSVLAEKPLKIYDDIYNLSDIETAARKADLQGGVDIMFVDYIQNCRVPGAKSKYVEQSELALGFQKLAKDVSATIICLSQISNAAGRGEIDQIELKGAGEWAAVSDISVKLEKNKTDEYLLGYFVKKNRHGRLAEHKLEYKSDKSRLEEAGEIVR